MRIVITGGAGFVGSNIAIKLKQQYPSYTITVFDNLKRRGSEFNLPSLRANDIDFIHGDIRNIEDLAQLPEFDCMIEASAEPSVMSGLDGSPTYVINNNLTGAINCFNECIKCKANLIFLSTSRVYPISLIENADFIEEDTRFSFTDEQPYPGISSKGISEMLHLDAARSFYGTTKLACELLIKEYQEFYGMKAAVTRFGVIAGPRQMGKTDQGVVTLWMARHFWKKDLGYIGYGGLGKQVRDILHIEDLIRLVDMQIHNIDKFNNKVYNAGGGVNCSASLKEMTAICEKISGNRINIKSVPENRPADLRIYISDNSMLENETGWKPEKTTHDIFSDIHNWLKENEHELKSILG
ncbi:MAG: NAD-dependent epimerase/dehydratase family protein [Chitinophagales bacterium]|nr:NAD-dependent epimerase/dehydratase family protein [Chitinophagales bacterium]